MSSVSWHTVGYRTLVLGLVVGLVAQVRSLHARRVDARLTVRQLRIGDTLSDVGFLAGDKAGGIGAALGRNTTQLHSLLTTRCTGFIFFESSCSACRDVAPVWAKTTFVRSQKDSIPVFWVNNDRHDEGAANFIATNQLNPTWFVVSSRPDLAQLGIRFTPIGYLIDRQRRLVGYLPPTPTGADSIPTVCRDGAT